MIPLRDSHRVSIFPIVTIGLVFLNVFVFLIEITSVNLDSFISGYALVPANIDFSNFYTLIPFLTSQFLHAGFLHIVSNMWFMKIFGDNVEERLGSILLLLIYLLSGTFGGVLQYIFSPNSLVPMLGASGAVAGVLGSYMVFFPNHKIETLVPFGFFMTTINLPASVMLFYWFLTQLFSGVGSIATAEIGGVAFWAHIGGFATGYLAARLFSRNGSSLTDEGVILD